MSTIAESNNNFILNEENDFEFDFKKKNFRKDVNNFLIWKDNIMKEIYENTETIFLIEWDFFINEDEKKLYSDNSENYIRKSILLFEIQLLMSLVSYLEINFYKLYQILWKDKTLKDNYFENLHPKIRVNIEIRYLFSCIDRIRQFYLSPIEKKRLSSIKKKVEKIENRIRKKMIPVESYMLLFYKTEFEKINSYDIRREIFSYL